MKLLVAFVAALAVAGCSAVPSQPNVEDAAVRLPAAPGVPGAGYFRIDRFSSQEVITGASSPAAERIEIHVSRTENGVSRMERVDQVNLDRNIDFVFAPGGHHLMLFGLREGLQPGGTIPLTLTFAKAQPVTVQARLEAPGGGNHAGH